MDVRLTLIEDAEGSWRAEAGDGAVVAEAPGREECLRLARERLGTEGSTMIVETLPRLAGVAEAAQVMGWDKRRVITYIDRGQFPAPLQSLASGRVWRRSDVEAFAHEWHARQERRRLRRAHRAGTAEASVAARSTVDEALLPPPPPREGSP